MKHHRYLLTCCKIIGHCWSSAWKLKKYDSPYLGIVDCNILGSKTQQIYSHNSFSSYEYFSKNKFNWNTSFYINSYLIVRVMITITTMLARSPRYILVDSFCILHMSCFVAGPNDDILFLFIASYNLVNYIKAVIWEDHHKKIYPSHDKRWKSLLLYHVIAVVTNNTKYDTSTIGYTIS